MTLSIVGILIGMVFFVVTVYKGWSTYYAAPLSALIVFLFSGMDLGTSFTDFFVTGMGRGFQSTFLIILSGSILGQVYTSTGAANALADGVFAFFNKFGNSEKKQRFYGLLVIYIVGGAMSMAGCSPFVCVMTVFPIALSILSRLDISRKCLAVVTFAPTTFALVCPGSPVIYNTLPTRIMGVGGAAGLIPGLVAALIIEVGSFVYVYRLMGQKAPDGFVMTEKDRSFMPDRKELPNFWVSLLPLLAVFVCYNVLKLPVYAAVIIAALILLVTCHKYIGDGKRVKTVLGNACRTAAFNAGNVAVVSGFGAAVVATPAYHWIVTTALEMNAHPLIVVAAVIAVLTGASGSASGAANACLAELGALATAQGVSAAAVARVAACAASTLDTLPTQGVILTINDLTGMTHKETYRPIAIVTVVITTIATIAAVALFLAFPELA